VNIRQTAQHSTAQLSTIAAVLNMVKSTFKNLDGRMTKLEKTLHNILNPSTQKHMTHGTTDGMASVEDFRQKPKTRGRP